MTYRPYWTRLNDVFTLGLKAPIQLSGDHAITIGISSTTAQNVDLARLQLNLLTRSNA